MAGKTQIRYYINPATGQPHIWDHGIEEWEVEDILEARTFDFPGRRGSRIALGQTSAGRYLKVVYVPKLELDAILVITAYELRGKALKAFRRLKRRRSGKRK